MAWQIPLSVSGTGVAANLSWSDSLMVAPDVTLASTTTYAVSSGISSGQQVVVRGSVIGAGGILGSDTASFRVNVDEGGYVAGLTYSAVRIQGVGTEVKNAGTIETLSPASSAVDLSGTSVMKMGSASLTNTGVISALESAILVSGFMTKTDIRNEGEILSLDDAFRDTGWSVDTIVNTGVIKGDIILAGGNDFLDSREGIVGEVSGGAGNDRLYSGAGSQQLNGDDNNDTLMGGAGADELLGGDDADTASYASAGAGVKASLSNAAGNTGDAKGDTYVSIERLIGSKFADTLIGNGEANQFTGGSGADTLTGGAGADRFVFNAKPAGSASADRITDFQTDLDVMRLDDAKFAGLATGDLAGAAFWASDAGTAHDGTDRVIYEKDTGWIRFDADGNGAGAAVAFAKLAAGLNLGADDFFVY